MRKYVAKHITGGDPGPDHEADDLDTLFSGLLADGHGQSDVYEVIFELDILGIVLIQSETKIGYWVASYGMSRKFT